jgi:hypothetical protein
MGPKRPHPVVALAALAAWCSLALVSCGPPLFDRANRQNDFHGIILDQDDLPVANAAVTLEVYIAGLWGGDGASSGGGSRSVTTVSDGTGRFSLPDTMIRELGIKAVAARYLIDNFGLTKSFCDRKAAAYDASHPCVVRAWKIGTRSDNRVIESGPTLRGKSFRNGDKQALRVKIHLTIEERGGSKRLRKNPTLDDAGETDDWDLELSLASDSPDAGESPFSFPGAAPFPRGMAIRVRARAGAVRQADPIFPLMAKNEGFNPVIDLNWSNTVQSDSDAYYKIFYRDGTLGYLSFLSIHCNYENPKDGVALGIAFDYAVNRAVSQLGVINLSGSGDLECLPEQAYNEGAEADLRYQRIIHDHQERYLDTFRRTNPKLAKEIEDRMRAEGKVVPPRK